MFSLLIPAFPEFGFCFFANNVREVVVDFVMTWDGNHKSIELEYLMTPSLPDTFKRNILLLLVIILLTPFLTTLSSVVFTFNHRTC